MNDEEVDGRLIKCSVGGSRMRYGPRISSNILVRMARNIVDAIVAGALKRLLNIADSLAKLGVTMQPFMGVRSVP